MTNDVNRQIEAVLENRRRLLPEIDREIARWEGVRQSLTRLDRAVAAVGTDDSPIAAGFDDLDFPHFDRQVADVLTVLATVRARVCRQTINIGVSGRARNGKSTLLQSLTGLADEQIPAGAGQPVTAVRSRIFYSPDQREATLTMHSEGSFCDEVLGGYHEELNLSGVPRTLEEFARWRYPQSSQDLSLDADKRVELAPMLVRLREMQESVDSYRGYLTGQVLRVELADLRRWVAYPDPNTAQPDRRYLAVRDARILCPFPVTDVAALGFCDLPGLGELAPRAEAHHLAGLQNDVDFVLIVKRPTDTNATWLKEDARGLGLICRAAGAAGVHDFVAILVNDGGCSQINVDALLADIDKRVNEGTGNAAYRRIIVDAAAPHAVHDGVLRPILAHLALALPRMDAAVIEHAVTVTSTVAQRLSSVVDGMSAALRTVMTPTAVEELIARASTLQSEVAAAVQEWIGQLEMVAADNYEDAEFYARVEQLQAGVRDWIVGGFDDGVDGWSQRALATMKVHRGAVRFALDEIDEIRVEIARRFSAIDDLLTSRREQFWAGLVNALGTRLVSAAEGADAYEALRDLAARLREVPEPCPTLADSIMFALDVRLDYRTRVLPRMRRALAVLRPEQIGHSGADMTMLSVPLTESGARELFTRISHLARQATHDAAAVLAEEPSTTAQVLLAFAEQFEDSFIRSARSRAEFRRMAEAFRDQLWPDQPNGPALATARVQHLRSVLKELSRLLGETATPKQERISQ